MAIEKILFIGQDEGVRGFISETLQNDYDVQSTSTCAEARDRVGSENFDVVFVDADAPDFGSFSDRTQTGAVWPTTIVVAGSNNRQIAVSMLNSSAFAYLSKPFSREELIAVVGRVAEHTQSAQVCRRYSFEDEGSLLGDSFVSTQLRSLLSKVAQTTIPALIRGGSGVGKEFLARLVHRQGARANGPFVKIDCAAVSENDLQQQLFGWSTWGPIRNGKQCQGALELAANGTVLIDEISLLPASVQSQLLKALQEKKFQRTDGTRWIPLEARVIATTTRELEKEIKTGTFNEQLFYLLNVVPIWVPPLKERPQDIRTLANSFARYYARKHGKNFELSREAIAALEHAAWPGNVRQLRSSIEQSIVTPQSAIVSPDFTGQQPTEAAASQNNGDIECLDEIEKRHILTILARCNGNRTLAAKRLGISIRTIRNKLKLYRTQQPNVELMQQAA